MNEEVFLDFCTQAIDKVYVFGYATKFVKCFLNGVSFFWK